MTPAALLLALALLSVGAFWIGKSRSLALVGGIRGVRNLHSLPSHYGVMTAMWCALPALAVIGLWVAFQDSIILRLITSHLPEAVRACRETSCRWSSMTYAISWPATWPQRRSANRYARPLPSTSSCAASAAWR
jgi:hypothetical protein